MIHRGVTGRDAVKAQHLQGWCGPGAYECDMTMYFASTSTLEELNTEDGLATTRCWPLINFDFSSIGTPIPVMEGCRTEWMSLMSNQDYRGKMPTRVVELYEAQLDVYTTQCRVNEVEHPKTLFIYSISCEYFGPDRTSWFNHMAAIHRINRGNINYVNNIVQNSVPANGQLSQTDAKNIAGNIIKSNIVRQPKPLNSDPTFDQVEHFRYELQDCLTNSMQLNEGEILEGHYYQTRSMFQTAVGAEAFAGLLIKHAGLLEGGQKRSTWDDWVVVIKDLAPRNGLVNHIDKLLKPDRREQSSVSTIAGVIQLITKCFPNDVEVHGKLRDILAPVFILAHLTAIRGEDKANKKLIQKMQKIIIEEKWGEVSNASILKWVEDLEEENPRGKKSNIPKSEVGALALGGGKRIQM